MRRSVAAALVLVGALLLAAMPAYSQSNSDGPGGSCHPVTSICEMPSNAGSGPVGGVVWQALSMALRHQMSLGLLRWNPLNDPSMARIAPNVVNPRRPSMRLGGWSKP